jgi:hypothetical protein
VDPRTADELCSTVLGDVGLLADVGCARRLHRDFPHLMAAVVDHLDDVARQSPAHRRSAVS